MPKTKVVMIEQRVRQEVVVPADLIETASAVQEYLDQTGWPDIATEDFPLSVLYVSDDNKDWRTPRE